MTQPIVHNGVHSTTGRTVGLDVLKTPPISEVLASSVLLFFEREGQAKSFVTVL